jgi:hypothetical protein
MKFGKNTDLLIVFVALGALAVLLYTSGNKKEMNMMSSLTQQQGGYSVPSPSQPLGQNEKYGAAGGVKTNTYGMQGSKLDDPSMLLPNDTNSQWASLNPQGDGMLKNVNLLQAGSLVGINTVGSSMRNANLQLRSEPPNPMANVGPWNLSTIEPDVSRQPLEIGGKL